MIAKLYPLPTRRILLALLLALLCFSGYSLSANGASAQQSYWDETPEVAAFRQSVGGNITPVLVELERAPAVVHRAATDQAGVALSMDQLTTYMVELHAEQDAFLSSLEARGVRARLREKDVTQVDGSVRHVVYRFSYVLNGFVAYVATPDVARLRALPEVSAISEFEPVELFLDKAIDYSLGTQTSTADRRLAVYGATQEFNPVPEAGHPEQPDLTADDGFEGQGMYIAVIDTGVDYRHPMFGGTGLDTPLPQIPPNPPTEEDNRKVVYFYQLGDGIPPDDFGHGTLAASNAAGYLVDGDTPPRFGYGTGPDGLGIGPTPNGAPLFGTAPQTRILAYKVCGVGGNCLGDIELAIEDAASPVILVGAGDGLSEPTTVPKPVADVINLSLGSTVGNPAGSTSRATNNAALAGTIVVASAGNSGEDGAATIGAPAAATLTIAVGASLDPGSIAGADVLEAGEVPDAQDPLIPAPSPETGADSEANAPNAGQPQGQGLNLFPVAGGGAIPDGSLSAHYVYADVRGGGTVPATVANRIAVVRGELTFFQQANAVAAANPAAILLVTNTESATAVFVVNAIPTFTISEATGQYLLDIIGPDAVPGTDPEVGTISQFPLRIGESVSLPAFQGRMTSFSSRGPNEEGGTVFNTVKPDVTAPGAGILGATTPIGNPDAAVGLANPEGYVQANGTSFSGPITAGAMVLIRQRVREELGLDETDLAATDYRERRFDAVTVSRALLQNSATNLRSGLGVPQADGVTTAAINDMGSGHINVAGALAANAIMVAPSVLRDTLPNEFTPPEGEAAGDIVVLLPTASFGRVEIAGADMVDTRLQEVIIRDLGVTQTAGARGGSGAYTLSIQNNRNLTDTTTTGFDVSFTSDAAGTNEITSVTVPAGGEASFFVRVAADGSVITTEPAPLGLTEEARDFQWYVTATGAGQSLRMPFLYRAVPGTTVPTAVTVNDVATTPANGSWLGLGLAGLVTAGALLGLAARRRRQA